MEGTPQKPKKLSIFLKAPAGNQGPWKWLPQKERTLQNRQLVGFCGVPFTWAAHASES